MSDDFVSRARYGEPFWRAHHEAWRRSDLNQREYCQAQEISLKVFGNWRAKFKAEPQLQAHKLLYRRGGLSHPLSHNLSHTLSHVTYPSSASPLPGPVVPPARDGHRRRFSDADTLDATLGIASNSDGRFPVSAISQPRARENAATVCRRFVRCCPATKIRERGGQVYSSTYCLSPEIVEALTLYGRAMAQRGSPTSRQSLLPARSHQRVAERNITVRYRRSR